MASIWEALSEWLPRERQTVPTANVLDYTKFKELYGRPPRQGELETEAVPPASYIAGQISGTNVAGGVPGPRFGALQYTPGLRKRALEALTKLKPEVMDFILRHPEMVTFKPYTSSSGGKFAGIPEAGMSSSTTTKTRFARAPEYPRPSSSNIIAEVGSNAPTEVAAHELGHTAMSLAGMEGRGLPGIKLSLEMANWMREKGYHKRNFPEEMAADFISNRLFAGETPTVSVFNPKMAREGIERYFPKQPGPIKFGPTHASPEALAEISQFPAPWELIQERLDWIERMKKTGWWK